METPREERAPRAAGTEWEWLGSELESERRAPPKAAIYTEGGLRNKILPSKPEWTKITNIKTYHNEGTKGTSSYENRMICPRITHGTHECDGDRMV